MRTFEEDLKKAIEYHGHLCAGQVLGTRIARIALKHFGIEDAKEYRDLIAFVEADRCVADAVCSIAACQMGRRRLKWYDYGKMAATFYDLKTDKAIRISIMGDQRAEDGEDVVEFFGKISDEDLFKVQNVKVNLDEFDIPGRPKKIVRCDVCGEKVFDNRHIEKDGETLCKVCAGEPTYYTIID